MELGELVRDKITGWSGVVIGIQDGHVEYQPKDSSVTLVSPMDDVETVPEPEGPQPEPPVEFARLVSDDGFVYEVNITEEFVTVRGRETGVALPRDVLDGE